MGFFYFFVSISSMADTNLPLPQSGLPIPLEVDMYVYDGSRKFALRPFSSSLLLPSAKTSAVFPPRDLPRSPGLRSGLLSDS